MTTKVMTLTVGRCATQQQHTATQRSIKAGRKVIDPERGDTAPDGAIQDQGHALIHPIGVQDQVGGHAQYHGTDRDQGQKTGPGQGPVTRGQETDQDQGQMEDQTDIAIPAAVIIKENALIGQGQGHIKGHVLDQGHIPDHGQGRDRDHVQGQGQGRDQDHQDMQHRHPLQRNSRPRELRFVV